MAAALCVGVCTPASFAQVSSTSHARLAALSSAPIAHPEGDVGFSTLNPALLATAFSGPDSAARSQVALSGAQWPGGLQQAELTVGFRTPSRLLWAVGVRQLATASLPLTDASGQVLGSFKAQETDPRVTVAYRLNRRWAAGATLHYSMLAYGQYTATALFTDVGLVHTWAQGRWAAGLVAKNLGGTVEAFGVALPATPVDVQLGLSNRLKYMPMRWSVALTHLETPNLSYDDPNAYDRDPLTGVRTYNPPSLVNLALRHVLLGAEFTPGSRLRIQMSYDFRRQIEMRLPTRTSNAGFSLGVGLRAGRMQYQYANTSLHVAGRLHQFGLVRTF
jgi:hypothetical protein